MFIRHVTMKLKANAVTELNSLIENDVLPILRKQPGFKDEITFVAPERSEAVAISFWDTKENLEAYNSAGYPELLKIVAKVVEGTPRVETFELATSTLHKLTAKA